MNKNEEQAAVSSDGSGYSRAAIARGPACARSWKMRACGARPCAACSAGWRRAAGVRGPSGSGRSGRHARRRPQAPPEKQPAPGQAGSSLEALGRGSRPQGGAADARRMQPARGRERRAHARRPCRLRAAHWRGAGRGGRGHPLWGGHGHRLPHEDERLRRSPRT
jgi:hypothetical protein